MIPWLPLLPAALAWDPGPWHVRTESVTDAPLQVGQRVVAEFPGRLRLTSDVGWMPGDYVHAINEIILYFDGYDRDTAVLVEESLTSSMVWRQSLGWRPFRRAGFYLEGGYTLVTLGGGVALSTVLAESTGYRIPDWMFEGYEFGLETDLHMATAELGWEGRIWRRLAWRFALGGFYTVNAETEITPNFDAGLLQWYVDDFCDDSERDLDGKYEEWFHAPTVTVGLGYAFF